MKGLLPRLVSMVPTLVLVLSVVFLLIHLVPGDPVAALLGERATVADAQALRHALGLDLPLPVQYWRFMQGVATGHWGVSMITNKGVLEMVGERLGATVVLALAAMAFAVVMGGLLGVARVVARRRVGQGIDLLTLAMAATPSFVIGPLLIVAIAVGLGWLPVSGNDSWDALILPAVTLGSGLSAVLARMLSASLDREVHRDYVRTVLAKGGSAALGVRHALRNALLPVIQVFFLQLGMVLTGTVLTEAVFGWPGLGNLLVEALHQRDYPVIQGCLLLISLTYMVCVLLADVVSAVADPRGSR